MIQAFAMPVSAAMIVFRRKHPSLADGGIQSSGIGSRPRAVCDRAIASPSPDSGAVLFCMDCRCPVNCLTKACTSGSESS